jgi:hypothetical protein
MSSASSSNPSSSAAEDFAQTFAALQTAQLGGNVLCAPQFLPQELPAALRTYAQEPNVCIFFLELYRFVLLLFCDSVIL